MVAKQDTLWFGYLEAGKKGSLVVRDVTLGTGTPSTIYLFNQKKGKILEYRLDIVEPKLRELTEKEADVVESLREEFEKVRTGFVPRVARRPISLPPPRKKRRDDEAPEPDVEDETPIKLDDDDDDDDDGPELLDDGDDDDDDDDDE